MSDILSDLMNVTGNKYASIVSDGTISDTASHIDTGTYSLNALLSGSLFKGFPSNKIIALNGESAVGKTYFFLSIVKNFLESTKNSNVIIFESESAISKKILEERGIPTDKVAIIPVVTVEEFRTQALRVLKKYAELEPKKRTPLLLGLDSLGMLSTEKEIAEIQAGSGTKDMTRASLIRGSFRVLTLELGKCNVPMVITNHVYASMSAYSGPEAAGGGGIKYAASMILNLTKRKEKVENEVVGNVITCTLTKGRDTIENKKAQVLLNYKTGLNKFYGLVDLAVEAEIFKKVSTKIELPDGRKMFESHIYKNAEEVFTPEILQQIDTFANQKYCYGKSGDVVVEDNEAEE